MTNKGKWRFAVDRGGTFTDVVGLDPRGAFHSLKLLSSSPLYEDASIEGIRRMLGLDDEEPLSEGSIEGIRFGTTVATNALLERKGCRTALIVTRGFGDLFEIGYQDRPDIFSLCIRKSSPLYSRVLEVDERMDSGGQVIRSPHMDILSKDLKGLTAEADAVAVVLMHSWTNPAHELICEEVLRQQGFDKVYLSHRAVRQIKIVRRGQSTLVDAYLSIELARYLEGIRRKTGTIPVEFMQSNGRLSPPAFFLGKSAILSGPAGGAAAVARISQETGVGKAIGFDMGGTSTDVSKFDGALEKIYETEVGGIPLQTEMLNIVTVAAGGGSILSFDGRKMQTGPESAGSFPGPACYGLGGPLTVTDANLVTGRLIPDFFPKTLGPRRDSSLDEKRAVEKFALITEEINAAMGTALSLQEVAAGFLRIANEKMAMAVRQISVSRGFDAREYALVCFGGAGGQHACSLATLLGIKKIIVHPLNSVMSAYGIGLAEQARKTQRSILKPYCRETHEELELIYAEMESEIRSDEERSEQLLFRRELDLRLLGTEAFLTLEYRGFEETAKAFSKLYGQSFGLHPGEAVQEIVNVRSEAVEPVRFFSTYREDRKAGRKMPSPLLCRTIFYQDGNATAPVFDCESLPHGAVLEGPAVIVDRNSTIIIDPGFEAVVDDQGLIAISSKVEEATPESRETAGPDPVLLEVFNHLFMGMATEMGITLRNTAHSVNMKERLDFSCALFDREGDLVANAPHIPVHLGSMADSVKAVLRARRGAMRPGDIYLTNNPYEGGSHLPDMTVICPVFSGRAELIFFTAARGHHSDVGGTVPGSMPPTASEIAEEGVLIDNFLLVRDGAFREEDLRRMLSEHPYPVRNIEERIADFRAQIAACRNGAGELQRVIGRYGLETVLAYMKHIQDNSERFVKNALCRFLGDGRFERSFEDRLDDGTVIKVSMTISPGGSPPDTLRAVIDFTGTGPQHGDDNLNAPLSVTRSSVMYVLRAIIENDIPLNSGCLKPIKIIIPGGTVLNPLYPAPVASGNVETSQRIVDVLLGALGVAAASQGTMNNLLFEVEGETPYYETIAGGAGALDDCPGASGVQVHMTNTRITDPEIIEFRHPGVRLEQFRLRKGSGGRGRFPGGDGVTREIRFLRPATVSILSERRVCPPYGLNGGGPGERGENILIRADGSEEMLGHRAVLRVGKDESVVIKTPGGGGYGKV